MSILVNTSGKVVPAIQNRSVTCVAWLGECLRSICLFPLLRICVPLHIEGAHRLQPGRAYVFAANHSSHLDAPVFLASLPRQIRLHVRIAAAADYFFATPWKGLLVRLLINAFPFERKKTGSMESLAYTARLVHEGQSVLIFPEGTRTKDGRLQPFKWGVGKLAASGDVSIVPTWIEGTFSAFPKGARWPRHHKVIVRFGAPLQFEQGDEPARIVASVEQAVRTLSHKS